MGQAFKFTFGSVWGWLGIFAGAISLINLGALYLDIGVGPVLERVVETYKSIVHVGFDYLFFWINWKMPSWSKDLAAVYIVFGTAFFRTQFRIYVNNFGALMGSLVTAFVWPFYSWKAIRSLLFWRERPTDTYEDLSEDEAVEMVDQNIQLYQLEISTLVINFVAVPTASFLFILVDSGT